MTTSLLKRRYSIKLQQLWRIDMLCFDLSYYSFKKHKQGRFAKRPYLMLLKKNSDEMSSVTSNYPSPFSLFFLFSSSTLFIVSPIWFDAVKEATMLLSISLPACGEFGSKIRFEFVSSPSDCKVS